MTPTLSPLVDRLTGQRVLVVGDVILDEYLIGRTTRLSREAPVPVLEFEARQLIPGGAANPSANIAVLGSTAVQAGVVGSDPSGVQLRQVLQARQIDVEGLFTDPGRPTTVKTRLLAQMGLRFPQQVARIDMLSREPISKQIERRLRGYIADWVPKVDVVLLSDYHMGLLTPSLVETIRKLAQAARVPLVADAQGHLDKYEGYTLVKCNADDVRDYLRRDLRSNEDFAAAAVDLRTRLRLTGCMVITRGGDGATVALASNRAQHCPAPDVTDVFDTVGAGDTAIAVMALAMAAGIDYVDGVRLANYASGLVVRRVGNYTPTLDELQRAVLQGGVE